MSAAQSTQRNRTVQPVRAGPPAPARRLPATAVAASGRRKVLITGVRAVVGGFGVIDAVRALRGSQEDEPNVAGTVVALT